jgi:hypothetical protein
MAITIVFISHPVTTSFLRILLAIKVLNMPGAAVMDVLQPVAIGLVACALGLLWPYYSIATLIFAAGSTADFFGSVHVFYQNPLRQMGPAVLGIAAIPLAASSYRIRFLVIAFATLAAIFALNYVWNFSHIFSRYLIFIILILQIMSVAGIAQIRTSPIGPIVVTAFVLVIAVAGLFQARLALWSVYGVYLDLVSGAPLGSNSTASDFQDLTNFGQSVTEPDAVVMSPRRLAYPVAALTGLRVVAVLNATPTMLDFRSRADDADLFFDASTSCEIREEILARRKVDFGFVPQGDVFAPSIAACGWPRVTEGERYVFYAPSGR